ncbi:hypothetical protein [Clavibacter michiganensis]|uniref:hypothetical protein n=1 Tax=Clavibacter michiganensis TaxID=28447 RepID=UPI003EB904D0
MNTGAATLDRAFTVPIYSQAEAARIIRTPRATLHRWGRGYESPTATGVRTMPALITLTTSQGPQQGATVPFVGLAEAFVLASFRATGLSMQRIRPALDAIRDTIGLDHALASQRLMTDGAEILWKAQGEGETDDRLIVVRNRQAVFHEVVADHLQAITFEGGFASSLTLPEYRGVDVTVDPFVNWGRPTLSPFGVAVDDIVDRHTAGESVESLAYDFGMDPGTVRSVLPPRAA